MPNFNDSEQRALTPDQIARLTLTVQEGALIKDWCQHAAYKIFTEWLNGKIADKKNEWLRAEDKEAEKIRMKATAWLDILDEFKRFILSGNNAAMILAKYHEQNSQENLEENPPGIQDKDKEK